MLQFKFFFPKFVLLVATMRSIAQYRMKDMGHVFPDLMKSSSTRLYANQTISRSGMPTMGKINFKMLNEVVIGDSILDFP